MKVRQDACKKLIDAADEIDEEKYDRLCGQFTVFVEAKLTLDAMPTVDAVPVVRCGECINGIMDELYNEKYCNGEFHALDWFCADGERA